MAEHYLGRQLGSPQALSTTRLMAVKDILLVHADDRAGLERLLRYCAGRVLCQAFEPARRGGARSLSVAEIAPWRHVSHIELAVSE